MRDNEVDPWVEYGYSQGFINNGSNKPSTYEVVTAYLRSLKVTTWPAVGWQIRDEAGLDAAATWVTRLVDHVNAVRNMAEGSTRTLDEIAEDYRRMVEGEQYRADR